MFVTCLFLPLDPDSGHLSMPMPGMMFLSAHREQW